MTTEEAIKQLEYDKAMCLFNPMTGEEKPAVQEPQKQIETERAEAPADKIERLKKRLGVT